MFVLKYAVLSCALGRTLSLSLSPPLFLQQARGNVERTPCFRLRMIDEADDDGLLLQDLDFPSFYKDMMHPEDGMVLPKPTAPECIRHHVTGHERLLLRISFRLDEQLYVPFTFVCHTGAPYHLYLSAKAESILNHYDRIKSSDLGDFVSTEDGRKSAVRRTPRSHQPGSIMGLPLLERFGLTLEEGKFRFQNPPPYI